MESILLMFIKWSSLQKSVSKFTLKEFYEIDRWSMYRKTYYGRNLRISVIS
jgi:hypothetical protein